MSYNKLRSLAKDSAVYGVAGVVNRMLTVLLVPVYTRIFLPADYGVLNLINTTFFLVGLLSACALDNAAARWYYDTESEENRKQTFASWFWFQFALSISLALVMFAAMPFFAKNVLGLPVQQLRTLWLLACATLVTNILPFMIWNWYRLRRRAKATIIFTLAQSIVTLLLTVLLVVVLKWHITGVFAALFFSSFTFSVVALFQMRPWLEVRYADWQRMKDMLRFAGPMVPAALAFWLINSTDAYFIRYFKDQTEVGLFAVGASMASAISLLTGAFQQAWGPFALSISKEADAPQVYAQVFYYFGAISSLVVLGMFLFSPEGLMIFTTPRYYGAAWVASILSINIVLIAFTYIASIGTSIAKNSIHYSVGVFIAAAVTVVLDLLLIPLWGKEGSALATVLAQLIVPVYLFYRAQKLFFVPYPFAKVAGLFTVAVLTGLGGRLLPIVNTGTQTILKVLIFFIFSGSLYYFLRNKKFTPQIKLSNT
jgi:O-antigen/teichoic acid export membrane protein